MPCVWFLEPVSFTSTRLPDNFRFQQQLCVLHLQTGRRSVQHHIGFEAAPGNLWLTLSGGLKNDEHPPYLDD